MDLQRSVQTRSLLMQSNIKFWDHYCKKENDIISTEVGKECNWCGCEQTNFPDTGFPFKTTSARIKDVSRVFGSHPQRLLTQKILPIDVFYKLYRSKND